MEDTLITLLESFGYPVIRQGSLAPNQKYPTTFFTFWCNSEIGHSFYDDEAVNVDYDFDVNVYSIDPDLIYSLLKQARILLRQNGFVTPDRGHDVMSDEITHTGRGMEVLVLANED